MKTDSTAHDQRCAICGTTEFPNGRFMNSRRQLFCYDKCRPKIEAKRAARPRPGRDRLAVLHDQINAAWTRRDELRRECDTIIESCKAEAERRAMERVRRMSVWSRIAFCFDPFKGRGD